MTSTRVPVMSLLAASLAFVLSACSSTNGGGSATSSADDETAVTAVTSAEANAGGRAFALERDDDGSWEVHVAVGEREVEVRLSSDATTVQSSRDDDGIDEDERAALDAAVTTLADAIRIAAAQNTGGEAIDEVQLDDDDGTWAWKVELDGGASVLVSAADGSVLDGR